MNDKANPALTCQPIVETYNINAITDKMKNIKDSKRTLLAEEEVLTKKESEVIGLIGGREEEEEQDEDTNSKNCVKVPYPRIVQLPMPNAVKSDGQSFLQCILLAIRVTLDIEAPDSGEQCINALLNTGSIIGLIREDVVHTQCPTTNINKLVQTPITGIRRSTAIGFAVVPIWFSCRDGDWNTVLGKV